jgi:hypothetical protein
MDDLKIGHRFAQLGQLGLSRQRCSRRLG